MRSRLPRRRSSAPRTEKHGSPRSALGRTGCLLASLTFQNQLFRPLDALECLKRETYLPPASNPEDSGPRSDLDLVILAAPSRMPGT